MDTASLITLTAAGSLAFITGLLKDEIKAARSDYKIYKNRFLDTNGDPKDPDVGLMCNPSTGVWGPIIVDEYSYSLFHGSERFVRFRHIDLAKGTGKQRQLSLAKFEAAARAKPEKPLSGFDWTMLANHGFTASPEEQDKPAPLEDLLELVLLGEEGLTTQLKNAATSYNSMATCVTKLRKTLENGGSDLQIGLLTESVLKNLQAAERKEK